jgi:hypothetical protein
VISKATKPYLVRAIWEWCADNGFTAYLAVQVDCVVSWRGGALRIRSAKVDRRVTAQTSRTSHHLAGRIDEPCVAPLGALACRAIIRSLLVV